MDIAILLVPLAITEHITHLQTEVSVSFKQLHSEVQKCLGHITLKLSVVSNQIL